MKLTVFSSDGKTSSEQDFATLPTFEGDKGLQAVKEVIVAINANNRQGTHSTKTRGEVRGGGDGGNTSADGGTGGDTVGCGNNGGNGGDAAANGGKGGDASLIVFGAPSPVFDIGGNGGNADALGGKGGNGGNCDAKGKGGNGGKGGNATDKEGKGGAGDTAGVDGISDSTGGNGGNGGSGCLEGKGGKGGIGDTPGADGLDGKNLCAAEPPKTTGTTGGDTPPAAATAKMSFAHVAPGEYSEVYMDITGAPGARANAALSGPAVEQPNASGVIGADGKLRLKWRIYQYGTYKASGTVGDSSVSGTVAVS
ncbi:MAG: 50S ribosomal protein L4 [Patescibacteria group bacterium]